MKLGFDSFLAEVRGEKAHKQAMDMGLKYKGFGYWADPQTGEAKYKTENDSLVPVEADPSSEMVQGQDDATGPQMPGAPEQPGMAGMKAANGMLQMPGQQQMMPGSNVLGAPEPGKEQAPGSSGWEAGPDGDTCVGPEAETPGEIPKDSYVGKTNYAKWVAGPDGDNMTNVDFKEIEEAYNMPHDSHQSPKRPGDTIRNMIKDIKAGHAARGTNTDEKRWKNIGKIAKGITPDDPGETTKNIAGGFKAQADKLGLGDNTINARAREGMPLGGSHGGNDKRKVAPKPFPPFGPEQGDQPESEYVEKTPGMKDNDSEYESMSPGGQAKRIVNMVRLGADDVGPETDEKANFFKDLPTGKRTEKLRGALEKAGFDADKYDWSLDKPTDEGKQSNEFFASNDYWMDPNFDLKLKGEHGGQGAYGATTLTDDGESIIKTGEIGEQEMDNLKALKDVAGFPDLLNGQFADGFDEKGFAKGRYAMSRAKGHPAWELNHNGELTPEDKEDLVKQIFSLRGEMHKKGISHNDMHGNNVFYDPETKQASIIDMGLSQNKPILALREAIRGHLGEDSQFSTIGKMVSPEMRRELKGKVERIKEMMDEYRDPKYPDEQLLFGDDLWEFEEPGLEGEVNWDPHVSSNDVSSRAAEFTEQMGGEEHIMKMIEALYDGLGGTAAERMNRAGGRIQSDSKRAQAFDRALKGRRIAPSKNIDFDEQKRYNK